MYYLRGGRRVHVLTQKQEEDKNCKSNDIDDNNQIFRQNHYYNMHKTIEQHKKQNGELQTQVEELRQLVGERDMQKYET